MACKDTKSCQDFKEDLQRWLNCDSSTGGDIGVLPEVPVREETLGDLSLLGYCTQVGNTCMSSMCLLLYMYVGCSLDLSCYLSKGSLETHWLCKLFIYTVPRVYYIVSVRGGAARAGVFLLATIVLTRVYATHAGDKIRHWTIAASLQRV